MWGRGHYHNNQYFTNSRYHTRSTVPIPTGQKSGQVTTLHSGRPQPINVPSPSLSASNTHPSTSPNNPMTPRHITSIPSSDNTPTNTPTRVPPKTLEEIRRTIENIKQSNAYIQSQISDPSHTTYPPPLLCLPHISYSTTRPLDPFHTLRPPPR